MLMPYARIIPLHAAITMGIGLMIGFGAQPIVAIILIGLHGIIDILTIVIGAWLRRRREARDAPAYWETLGHHPHGEAPPVAG